MATNHKELSQSYNRLFERMQSPVILSFASINKEHFWSVIEIDILRDFRLQSLVSTKKIIVSK